MAEPLRVLIVDDEPNARAGLRNLLARHDDVIVAGECADGPAAVDAIARLAPDLVLLDVQMPGMSGLDVVASAGVERMPPVIFVTAYDRFAIDAFDVNAIDYLLKPFDDDRFDRALIRAKQAIRDHEEGDWGRRLLGVLELNLGSEQHGYATRLVVKDAGRVFFVRTEDIDWIEAADYYVKLHVLGTVHLLRESMRALEARLDPQRFFRIHRSAIVNLDRVRELQPYFKRSYLLTLRDGTQLKLSRSRRERLETLLGQSL